MTELLFPLTLSLSDRNSKRLIFFASPWARNACVQAILQTQGYRGQADQFLMSSPESPLILGK